MPRSSGLADNNKKKMEQPELPPPGSSTRDLVAELLAELRKDGRLAQLLAGAAPSGAVLSGDMLRGAGEIAAFLYGEARHRRKIYRLIKGSRLPHFRIGRGLCARKSVLIAWIAAQEGCAGGSA
jgi:hypothetical protein